MLTGLGDPPPYTGGVAVSGAKSPAQLGTTQWTLGWVSPRSVARVAALLWACLWVVVVIAGLVLWQVGRATGLIANAESFWAQATGQSSASFNGVALLVVVVFGGLVVVAVATVLSLLGAMLFNAVCDLTGGVKVAGTPAPSGPGPRLAPEPSPRQPRPSPAAQPQVARPGTNG